MQEQTTADSQPKDRCKTAFNPANLDLKQNIEISGGNASDAPTMKVKQITPTIRQDRPPWFYTACQLTSDRFVKTFVTESVCKNPSNAYLTVMTKLNREELIRLVDHIMTTSGCIVDVDALLSRLEQNVPHPNVSELIFNPPSGKAMTAEQIVDLALSY